MIMCMIFGIGVSVLPATVQELRKAFKQHTTFVSHAQPTSKSAYLLLFYAVECGAKSIWLREKKIPSTDKITDPNLMSIHGHDLSFWAKSLRIPALNAPALPQSLRLNRPRATLPLKEVHQAWRYGIELNLSDEQALVNWLKQFCQLIEERL